MMRAGIIIFFLRAIKKIDAAAKTSVQAAMINIKLISNGLMKLYFQMFWCILTWGIEYLIHV